MPKTRARTKRQRICPWCFLSFSKEEHLSRHIRSHTKEKPFNCSSCGKSFSRHDSLLRHMRAHDASNQEEETFGPAMPSLDTPTVTDHSSVPSASLEPHSDEFSQFHTHGTTSTNLLPPGHHDSSSHSQTGLMIPNGLFDHVEDSSLDFDRFLQAPVWLADEDFDLNALNSSVMESALGLFSPAHTANESNADITLQIPMEASHGHKEDQVRQYWFNYVGTHSNGYVTPETATDHVELDEKYRQNLSQRLQQRVPTEPLPSTEFLNLCIQLFFTRFNPVFPIVHAPTFRPSAKSSLLLLSICSIGSLFVGSNYAVTQGSIIFERLNKAILSSWEKYLLSGKAEALAMTQASLIGQTFALLSGKPRDLLTLQTFHGTVTTVSNQMDYLKPKLTLNKWARLYKMFEAKRTTDHLSTFLDTRTPEEAWRTWVQAEERSRVAAGLHILDTEISELVLTHPLMRHDKSLLPLTARHELWVAPNATQWRDIMIRRAPPEVSSGNIQLDFDSTDGFHSYTELEGINARLMEQKFMSTASNQELVEQFEPQLIHFLDRHFRSKPEGNFDPFCLEVLWHSVFISLLVDISRLELAIGREGYEESLLHRDYVHTWSSSQEARRCALHGALILRKLQNMPLGVEPAIHVPRALYRAASVWYVYTEFGGDQDTSFPEISPRPDINFPEMSFLKLNSEVLLFEANGYRTTKPKTSESSTLCGLVDLLHRIGHWGLSRKFAEQLSILLKEKDS
ncbi:hypothetical protein N7481_013098 [Penicillium waksmanii]|uniref:uncharacterized protein n=1 Tax=Penicillium waksmanii TaxID=69791 RepID=UPI00254950A8|nr:uncharacterized protein N7481_013098 [Penicillium waksmanii]KAJ5966384.1 hypothetical protein N7481_013098 [Penicillium waksmanii]